MVRSEQGEVTRDRADQGSPGQAGSGPGGSGPEGSGPGASGTSGSGRSGSGTSGSGGQGVRPATRSLDRDAGGDRAKKEHSGWRAKLDNWLERADDVQQEHRFVAIPIAVWRKFADDDGVKLASLISYYAFLSIFPLLIVLATVLSRVLSNNPEAADAFVQSAAGSFLSIGSDDSGSIRPLDIAGFALVIATLVALWSGLAVANAIQDAANVVYEVPKTERPGILPRTLRSITLLVVVGIGLPATTALQGLAGKLLPGLLAAVVGWALVIAANTCLLGLAFARATVAQTAWRTLVPGALAAAVAWSVAQQLGTDLLTRRVEGAEQTYGSFALVIGILFWFFLLAQITLYCCELNVVLEDELWPRSLHAIVERQAETEADVRAYSQYPQREKQAHNIEVDVNVTDAGPQEGGPDPSQGGPAPDEGGRP